MYASFKKSMNPPEFGTEIREAEFNLDPTVAYLNQGSYGNVPKSVEAETRRIEDDMERDFDMWYRVNKSPTLDNAIATISTFFGANPENLGFEENTTRGINNVMKSIPWVSGDAILCNNWTYGAMVNIIDELVDENEGVTKIVLENPYPMNSEEQLLQEYESMLMQNPNIRLVLIDHISSTPSVLFPVKQLVTLCHQYDAMVLIDGAHVPGQVSLNLEDLGADFYVGNLHKWSFSSRPCAIVHVDSKHHEMVRPVVTSFGYKVNMFPNILKSQGTRNEAAYASTPTAIDFIEWIGGIEAMHAYCTPMLSASVDRITQEHNTEKLQLPASMECPNLRCVEIPDIDGFDKDDTRSLMLYIREQYNIWVPPFKFQDKFYLRISSSVYCTEDDYRKLDQAIKDLVENGPNPEALAKVLEKSKTMTNHI